MSLLAAKAEALWKSVLRWESKSGSLQPTVLSQVARQRSCLFLSFLEMQIFPYLIFQYLSLIIHCWMRWASESMLYKFFWILFISIGGCGWGHSCSRYLGHPSTRSLRVDLIRGAWWCHRDKWALSIHQLSWLQHIYYCITWNTMKIAVFLMTCWTTGFYCWILLDLMNLLFNFLLLCFA